MFFVCRPALLRCVPLMVVTLPLPSCSSATFAVLVYTRGRLVQIRGLLIDAEDENVGLSRQLLEDSHEDLNSLEDCVKR